MSWQESCMYHFNVAPIVDKMISDDDVNVEILIYREVDGEWIITKDRPFFSLGYKLEDVIVTQEEEIKKLHNEIASLKSMVGSMSKQLQSYQNEICVGCLQPKYQCRCFVPHWKWNEIMCMMNKDDFSK